MLSALDNFSGATVKNYTTKELFAKTEALLVSHKPNWAPRVIYKGTDLYNAISGPMFQELMERLSCGFDHMKGPHRISVAYKKTPEVYVKSLHQVPGEFIESDFSANDMRQCSDVMLLEMALMRRLGCPEWFVRLHHKSNHFVVKNKKHAVSAQIDNQLPTGATDTTFRNSFWNATILYAFLLSIKSPSSRSIILGDDMLARITGLPRFSAKKYVGVAAEANMVAEVFRRKCLVDCTFCSKLFVPRCDGSHLTVPLIGKALARFNMRANRNHAVSNNAYMAGKAIGYAYEFRFYPPIRDLFLDRFTHEYSVCGQRTISEEGFYDSMSWNARQAGITLRDVRAKLVPYAHIQHDDFNAFCCHRYGVMAGEMFDLFEDVVLSLDAIDVSGNLVATCAADFL
jgi:hypothetical protein